LERHFHQQYQNVVGDVPTVPTFFQDSPKGEKKIELKGTIIFFL
jgi:hypothetical protein